MPRLLCLILLLFLQLACTKPTGDNASSNTLSDYTTYVNPMIGTSKMGHVFPGATSPFGMVQLSPQTNFEVMYQEDGSYNKHTYEYCAGYQYSDTTILGFAHTNFSGTGHSDLGDLLVMPTTGPLVLEPLEQSNGAKGFYSTFSHDTEEASPGYYGVDLESYDIQAALTASERVGMHRYTFPRTEEAHILLDLVYNVYHHDNKNVWTFLRVENDSLITGYRQTKGWARTKKVFFAMQFSKPFSSYGHQKYDELTYNGFYRRFEEFENFPEMAGKDIRAYFNFDVEAGEELLVKMALSNVSTAGALKNMEAEVPHWDFDAVHEATKAKWNQELAKIEVEPIKSEDLETFYTAMYHTCLAPVLYEDVDGHYRGLDQNIHQSEDFEHYTIFSLWDTYRALHPFLNLVQPARNNDMIKSMLAHQEQSVHGMLPIWSHYANENWCMIGYHATSVIADAAAKQVGDFDLEQALAASVETANVRYFEGIGDYIDYGYVPDDLSHSSVSKTLEYAYNDWCIAQLASQLGQDSLATVFMDRAKSYAAVYDASIGFMRPKLSSGDFRADFDPMDTHGQGFIEGNAWNYGLYVPHEVDTMIAMMGGKERMTLMLDSLFTMEIADKYIEQNEDITRDGIIGNYVQGNEPGHHIPYLYNWTGAPEKTQERVRMILNTMYGPGVDGLCGNDDAGQMSAWYLFSSLGFYPVCPGSTDYAIGSPGVVSATIHLENGQTLEIQTEGQSETAVLVDQVFWNGEEVEDWTLNHLDLMQGGTLLYKMQE
jgi:predicted alpha-1,2-mannosidase